MPRVPPPFLPKLKRLSIYRGVRELDLKVVYPNGDSYLISLDEARCLLRNYKLLPHVVDRLLDAVWGIYAISADLKDGSWYSIEPEPEEVNMPGPLDGIEWILGENNQEY